jgi:hypothetical protein
VVLATVWCLTADGRAATPVVTITPLGARIQIAAATLADSIDAFARAAGFKVTYEGSRPSAMLFNAEINTPSVALTLNRLLEGQNLNYGVVFDPTGTRVAALMVFGPAPRAAAGTGAGASGRPQPFPTPRNPRSAPVPVEEDDELDEEPEPAPEPTPAATPAPTPPVGPTMISPFGPRPPFGRPFGAAPAAPAPPSPSPSP